MGKGVNKETCGNLIKKQFKSMPHQENLVKAFTNQKPGLKGMCLFWQLGCGKTCGAILVANKLIEEKQIDVVYILSPGALRSTWVKEYCEKCGITREINRYIFMTYNYAGTLGTFEDMAGETTFRDRSLVIVDEVHSLLNGVQNKTRTASMFYEMLMSSKCRILCLTGTLDKYDILGLLINLLNPVADISIQTASTKFGKYVWTTYDSKAFGDLVSEAIRAENKDWIQYIQSLLEGIISYFSGINEENLPKITQHEPLRIEMSEYQESLFWQQFEFEDKIQKPKPTLKTTNFAEFTKQEQLYIMAKKRMLSRSVSNFRYPEWFIGKIILPATEKRKSIKIKDPNPSDSLSKFGGWIDYKEFKDGQLKKYSPKITGLILNILAHSNDKQAVFTSFKTRSGARLVFSLLRMIGFSCLIFSGDSSDIEKTDVLNKFNDDENIRGNKYRILILTEAGSQGISLMGVRHIHILESSTRSFRTKQAIGRVARFSSHTKLSEKERTVEVWRYWSVSKHSTVIINKRKRTKIGRAHV